VKAAQMLVRRMLRRGEEPSRALVAIATTRGDFDVDAIRATA
jgi:predicted small integral membrane protein